MFKIGDKVRCITDPGFGNELHNLVKGQINTVVDLLGQNIRIDNGTTVSWSPDRFELVTYSANAVVDEKLKVGSTVLVADQVWHNIAENKTVKIIDIDGDAVHVEFVINNDTKKLEAECLSLDVLTKFILGVGVWIVTNPPPVPTGPFTEDSIIDLLKSAGFSGGLVRDFSEDITLQLNKWLLATNPEIAAIIAKADAFDALIADCKKNDYCFGRCATPADYGQELAAYIAVVHPAHEKSEEETTTPDLKIGDKVVILDGSSSPGFMPTMEKFIGRETTIRCNTSTNWYSLDNAAGYAWHKDWLKKI